MSGDPGLCEDGICAIPKPASPQPHDEPAISPVERVDRPPQEMSLRCRV